MNTLLARKSNFENPFATNDSHHDLMSNDPTINQFPQGTSFNSVNSQTNFNNQQVYYNPQPQQQSLQITHNQGESLKNTGGAMQDGADVLIKNENTDWVNKKWRPMMGWVYMATCTADFVLFPILWSMLQALSNGQVTSQWQPLTLQGAGLYHIAMGAVLGIAAYGRTKEKVAGAA
jgi:hypothetical protein